MKKRFMSMLLVLCMVFTLFPSAAFAEEAGGVTIGNTALGTSSVTDSGAPTVCESHKTHTEDCGYIEAVEGIDCSHLQDGTYSCAPVKDSGDVSGNVASPGDAEEAYVCDHSDDCGYKEAVDGADCTHECELCKPAAKCDCIEECIAADDEGGIEGLINPDCTACAAEGADLAAVCKGEAPALLATPRAAITGDQGIFAGRYSHRQVFDCARNPADPVQGEVFEVSNFKTPYGSNMLQLENIAGKIFYFKPSNVVDAPFALYMMDADGGNDTEIFASGNIYGLGAEGFLYDDNHYGTFISNGQAFNYGESLTYTPDIKGPISLEQGKAYVANDQLLGVEEVTNTDTGAKYHTLQDAIDAVAPGETLQLGENLREQVLIPNTNTSSFTIDLNGKTLDDGGLRSAIDHNGAGTLTIKDSSTGKTGKVSSTDTAINNNDTGTVTVSGGTVSSTTNIAIYNNGTGTITVSGNAIIDSTNGTAIYNDSTGTVTISGGSPVIKGFLQAMNKAPTLGAGVTVKAYSDYTAQTLVTPYVETNITTYRYLKFEAAPVVNTDTGAGYDTLQDAIDAVATGETLQLDESLTENVTIPNANTSFTIDLNGKTLNGGGSKSAIDHQGSGTLTITDNSAGAEKGKITSNSVLDPTIAVATGSLKVTGGTVSSTNSSAIFNEGTGTITISGGEVSSTQGTAIENENSGTVTVSGNAIIDSTNGIAIHSNGTLSVSGGKVSSTGYTTIYNESTGEVSITGGEVSSTGVNGTAIYNEGTVTVSGGKVSSTGNGNGNAIYNYGTGTVEITGGTVSSTNYIAIENNSTGTITVSGGSPVIKGGDKAMNTAPTLGTGVTVKAYSDYAGTQTVEYNSDNIQKYRYLKFETAAAAAVTNITTSITYNSLQVAINNVAEGNTLQLDTSLMENVTIPDTNGNSFTIDLNGKTLDGESATAITHNGTGTLTIEDKSDGKNGKITSNATSVATINVTKGSLTVTGGTVSSAKKIAIENKGTGTVTVSGGTVSSAAIGNTAILNRGTVTVSGGTVSSSSSYAIFNNGTGKVTVSGSATVSSTNYIAIFNDGNVSITGGTVSSTSTNSPTIYNNGAGTVTVSGGEVSSADSIAIFNEGTGKVTVSGGTVSSTSTTSTAIFNKGTGKVEVTGGSPVIKGGDKAMNTAPDTSSYANVKVVASINYDGIPLVTYNPADIETYKYLTFETGSTQPEATVTTVAVTPKTANVQKGNTEQFNVAVTGTNNPAQTVTWEVTGGKSGTGISVSGLLTVAADETATSLTVKATSTVDNTKSDTATVTVTTTPVTTYTLTATAGTGGSISPSGSVSVSAGDIKTFTISASSGYSISSVTVDGVNQGAIGTYTFSNVTADHAISATFSYNGSGGGGGGGGSSSGGSSSNVTVTPPAPDKPNDPTKAEIKVETKVDGKGGATVNVTDKDITDAINKATAEAKKNGDEANGITIVLNATTGNKTVNTVTVNLPKTVQEKVISNKIVSTVVVVDNPDIKIGMDLKAVTEINTQAKSDVTITATRMDSSKLTGNAKTAIGSRPVFDLSVNYSSGKQVQSFGSGSVSVSIPYTLQSGEVAGGVYAVYVDGNGKVNYITNSSYDANAKVLRFATNHFSVYGIGYKAPIAFTDIASHWAKADIEFVVNRGLMSGTSNTTFAPDSAMTRGMFVTALGRLAGVDVNSYKTGKFTDVKADAYYAPYVNWAASKGITSGTTATTFSPDTTVTRQEMAVLMSNYAKAYGYTVPKTRTEVTFADNSSIGNWAADAVKQMQMAGILNGKDGNKFDPTGTATRGEISAMLHRYVELVIDRTTAEGWTTNDSGSGMYYQSGKAVTGTKTINSVAYNFNAYGETTQKVIVAGENNPALVTDNKKYALHTVKKNEYFYTIAKQYGCNMTELMALNGKKMGDIIHPGDVLKIPQK